MAFISEDGTGLIDSNAYGTVQGFKDYFSDRGVDVSAISDPAIQTLLIQATDYVEKRYSGRFKGCIEFPETPQALSFPRLYVYDSDNRNLTGVPRQLAQAIYEYGFRANTETLAPDPEIINGKVATRTTDIVGPIEETREYESGGAVSYLFKPYPAADALLRELLTPSGGRVIRA